MAIVPPLHALGRPLTRRTGRLLAAASLLLWGIAATAIEFDGPFPTHDYPYPVHDSGVAVQADEVMGFEQIAHAAKNLAWRRAA